MRLPSDHRVRVLLHESAMYARLHQSISIGMAWLRRLGFPRWAALVRTDPKRQRGNDYGVETLSRDRRRMLRGIELVEARTTEGP